MSPVLERPGLVFLCHRIPYPPDKGDKIRSWNLLRTLAAEHRIFLLGYVDDKRDFIHKNVLDEVCEECVLVPLNRLDILLRAVIGLFRGQAISVSSYSSRRVNQQIDAWLEKESIERMLVFSGAVARVPAARTARLKKLIVDFVDVDSEKWRAYAEKRGGIGKWFFQREARLLAKHEREVDAVADVSVLVSCLEAKLFQAVIAAEDSDVRAIGNGVDHSFFSVDSARKSPYGDALLAVVFTGAMDYPPNVEAVIWFATEVLPSLRKQDSRWCFAIVGRNPTRKVRGLAEIEGCIVTGAVDDVRPWLQYAMAAVAPMQVARGVQNKVLEAMSMGKVVVASASAMEGLDASTGLHCIVADQPSEYLDAFDKILRGQCVEIEIEARKFVIDRFDWAIQLAPFCALLGDNR